MKRRSWPWLAGIAIVTAGCIFFLSSRFLPSVASASDFNPRNFRLLGTVIELIKYDYVEEPDPAKTMDGAFRGLVDSLDVLSTYLDPARAIKYRQSRKVPFTDVGAVLIKAYGGFPEVVGLVGGSPAEKGGLKLGDYISSINNRSTYGLSLIETQLALKSQVARPVKVKVLRQNQTLFLTLDRTLLYGKPATYSPAKGTAGIVHVQTLRAPCVEETQKILQARLKGQSLPLVLDLRNCNEGDLEETRRFLNLFIKTDKAGVFLKRKAAEEVLSCPQTAPWSRVPLVVWTNLGTQGQAEIAAGVLQDFGRAKVVGLTTAGLTASTKILPLEDGSALVLTTGVFSLNSGKKIWGQGVKPDGEVPFKDPGGDPYLKKTLELVSTR